MKIHLFLFFLFISSESFAFDTKLIFDNARDSVVHIEVNFVSPLNEENVCSEKKVGSGFIISNYGHVITAAHILKPLKECEGYTKTKIFARIGYISDPEVEMDIAANPDHFNDVALLKLVERRKLYIPSKICNIGGYPESGERFLAHGFPAGKKHVQIDVKYSGQDRGNKWSVDSSFIYGFSGGAIYNRNGYVVGIALGGEEEAGTGVPISSLNYATPLNSAVMFILQAGVKFEDCSSLNVVEDNTEIKRMAREIREEQKLAVSNTLNEINTSKFKNEYPFFWSFENTGDYRINVCFEPEIGPTNIIEISWIKKAISNTWERYSKIKFTGWEKCKEDEQSVRIKLTKVINYSNGSYAHTKGSGWKILGIKNGVVIPIGFKHYGFYRCNKNPEKCVTSMAVHEFGHILGFPHEHTRPDTPDNCKRGGLVSVEELRSQDTYPEKLLSIPYDNNSVMNYCNMNFYNYSGHLSYLDIEKLQAIYGEN